MILSKTSSVRATKLFTMLSLTSSNYQIFSNKSRDSPNYGRAISPQQSQQAETRIKILVRL